MVFNKRGIKARTQMPSVQQNTLSVKTQEVVETSNNQMWSMNKLVRPALTFVLSMAYDYYIDGRPNFVSYNQALRGLELTGSVFLADWAGNKLFPHLAVSKNFGIREIENMVIEPILTGGIYAGGRYLMYGNTNELLDDVMKGAGIDLVSGLGEGVIINMM